jgi:hypothetical protein
MAKTIELLRRHTLARRVAGKLSTASASDGRDFTAAVFEKGQSLFEGSAFVPNSEIRKRLARQEPKPSGGRPQLQEAFAEPDKALLKAWLTGWEVVKNSDKKEQTICEAAEQIIHREIEWGKRCSEVKCT